MKKHLILMVLVLAALTQSCKKAGCYNNEEVSISFDTVPMHPYFPAYPGSFWEYDDGSMTTIASTYDVFKKHISKQDIDTCIYETNSVELGVKYGSYLLQGNSFYKNFQLTSFGALKYERKIIDTIVGNTLYYQYNYLDGNMGGPDMKSEVIEEYIPTLTIQDTTYTNIYKTKYTHTFDGSMGGFSTSKYRYYAKDVGLIIEEKLDAILGNPYRKELVNYHINN